MSDWWNDRSILEVPAKDVPKFLWQHFEADHKPGAWEALNAGYAESHRAYHAWGHIGDLLVKLAKNSLLATEPKLIATAIYWHDAVYQTQNAEGLYRSDKDNVRDSAALFRRYTTLPAVEVEAVYEFIMATANHLGAVASSERYPGFAKDFGLFLDLDLSPLGAAWEACQQDTLNIRKEFNWVPHDQFCAGRAKVLQGFVDAKPLFRNPSLDAAWGDKARANLRRSIVDLKNGKIVAGGPHAK